MDDYLAIHHEKHWPFGPVIRGGEEGPPACVECGAPADAPCLGYCTAGRVTTWEGEQ
jgi:hypothetical protein